MEGSRNFPFLSNAFVTRVSLSLSHFLSLSFFLFVLNRDDRLSSFVDNSFQVPRKNGLSIERPFYTNRLCIDGSARAWVRSFVNG